LRLEQSFDELKALGAECIADIDVLELLYAIRNHLMPCPNDLMIQGELIHPINEGVLNEHLFGEGISLIIEDLQKTIETAEEVFRPTIKE